MRPPSRTLSPVKLLELKDERERVFRPLGQWLPTHFPALQVEAMRNQNCQSHAEPKNAKTVLIRAQHIIKAQKLPWRWCIVSRHVGIRNQQRRDQYCSTRTAHFFVAQIRTLEPATTRVGSPRPAAR